MSQTALPDLTGIHYLDYLARLHDALAPRAYLEIGTRWGDSLKLASCASVAIDPEFIINSNVIGSKPMCVMAQCTSDHFFERNRIEEIFHRKIDLAFLDGLHLFEVLLRDFINTERACHPGSWIAIHDCIPTDIYIAERIDNSQKRVEMGSKEGWWTGDVWKIIPILRRFRPNLTITSVDCAPTGLVFVTCLDPTSSILADNYTQIVAEFLTLDLQEYGLGRLHTEAALQTASSLRVPFRPWY